MDAYTPRDCHGESQRRVGPRSPADPFLQVDGEGGIGAIASAGGTIAESQLKPLADDSASTAR